MNNATCLSTKYVSASLVIASRPGVHYDPLLLVVHAADHASVRLVTAMAVNKNIFLKHVKISAAFLHERYEGAQPFYVEHIPAFDSPSHSNQARNRTSVLRVLGNMYGTLQVPRVYADGLVAT